MLDELKGLDLRLVKIDLHRGFKECLERGLSESAKWLSELRMSLSKINIDPAEVESEAAVPLDEKDQYDLARTLLELREYDRCAYFLASSKHPKLVFLHHWAKFLAIEKRHLDNVTEINSQNSPCLQHLRDLLSSLNLLIHGTGSILGNKLASHSSQDGYLLYLHGIILKKLKVRHQAVDSLVKSINMSPLNWGAWLELAQLITDRCMLSNLKLPNHWIKYFFIGYMYLELQMNEEAIEIYNFLKESGFEKCSYVDAQIAIAYHNKRDVEIAVEIFRNLTNDDPFRLDNMDTYSNLLYVKEMRAELAHLAHQVSEIDKYRAETCVVIGNFYSLRNEHQKAVQSFQRALRLKPNFLSAWTLMGHEYMELKNINAAMKSYRQAIEVNWLDYRAWYGLGQTYEILKMPQFSQYHYKRAQALRPNDSRMLIALGEANEKVDKFKDAMKCYYKARNVGDIERTALLKLAKLHDTMGHKDNAAELYLEFAAESQRMIAVECSSNLSGGSDRLELARAFKYLANHFLNQGDVDQACMYCNKCLEFEETKEEGKALLRSIAEKRHKEENANMQVDVQLPEEVTPAHMSGGHSAVPTRLEMSGLSNLDSPCITPSLSAVTPCNPDATTRSDMSLTDSDDTPMALSP
ncbi:cell division cycle protein 23 homolog [Neocloeon triangulifer]|uniref:cell division cycle protein 23 homolog n=1 Tax=Neocloeon triangulifer TaxID=2078957 RepID=UPI00286F2E6D|nr:cell division cycle protein 23 homolog [Neocloeon triangulifer]